MEPRRSIEWGQTGFCGLHRKILTESQIAVCLWFEGSGLEIRNGLFVLEESLKQ